MNIRALMEALETETPKITKEEKQAFLEAVRGFSNQEKVFMEKQILKNYAKKLNIWLKLQTM